MANYSIFSDVKTQIKNWEKNAIRQVESISNEFTHILGRLFVTRARENLRQYDSKTERYLGNIYYDPRSKQVIVRNARGEEPDIMWYLEFGTGIVGKNNPHPEAARNGWLYAINEHTKDQKGSPWKTLKKRKRIGWYVNKTEGEQYHAKDDLMHYKRPIFFTSGIPPARYIYNTMLQIDELIELAKQKMNAERK